MLSKLFGQGQCSAQSGTECAHCSLFCDSQEYKRVLSMSSPRVRRSFTSIAGEDVTFESNRCRLFFIVLSEMMNTVCMIKTILKRSLVM